VWTWNPVNGLAQAPPRSERPVAVVSEPDHDFGILERGELVTHGFSIRNEGTGPLTISRVELSQPFMKSRFQRVIPANGEGRITIEWDTSNFTGDLAAEARVFVDDPAQRQLRLTVRGIVRSPIDVLPAPAVYFSAYRDENPSQTLSIVNNEDRPLRIESLQREGSHFTADLRVIRDGKSYEIAITVPKGLPAGRYVETLFVETDHPRRRQLRIGVNVFVKNDVYATPERVNFGEIRLHELRNPLVNKLFVQSFMVRKRRGTFTITDMSSGRAGLKVTAEPTGSSSSFRIDVSLAPEAVQSGSVENTVRLRTDDPDYPELIIPVEGSVR